MNRHFLVGWASAAGLILSGCSATKSNAFDDGATDQGWALHGRSVNGARFSPMSNINSGNIRELGLAWSFKIDPDRGMQATPIVVDGVMYVTGPYSIVYALDATTGQELWHYDPEVDRGITGRGCCGPNNRGVAVANGKVYVGVFDGRLVSLDAKSGKVVWSADTIVDRARNYTITGAPVIAGNVVVIGNGGAEFGVRGYITAYDLNTGKQAWRFFTVPGGPGAPDSNTRAMKIAQPTWYGKGYIEQGGGGTVWDSMIYDPELDLLYIGVGNASFFNRTLRSEGKGDNLFVSSIVALRPKTGEYVWHYQTTPGDSWDYTATQNMILADLQIGNRKRKVIMQAPKNGFFYVLDRVTGQFISAKNFVPVNWASGIDQKTGRAIVNEAIARYGPGEAKVVSPDSVGAHNWQPMSFSAQTGLVYIPAQITAGFFQELTQAPMSKHLGTMNVGGITGPAPIPAPGRGDVVKDGKFPSLGNERDREAIARSWKGRLIAWDPIRQRAVWSHDYDTIWNGGVLSTGGDLVFQGTADGRLVAFRASDGKLLWQFSAQTGVMAPPVTYRIKGEQYIAVAAGWGGIFPLLNGALAPKVDVLSSARILVFKLGGKETLPPQVLPDRPLVALPANGGGKDIKAGALNYAIHCSVCHGADAVAGGAGPPDLRSISPEVYEAFPMLVKGALTSVGMPDFSEKLSDKEIVQIRQYIASRNADLRREKSK
ncbi:PQQ-dependent dehydrogenase, methanol/ethanol family [Sphingobium sp. JS3065]|uniref:PQQ-dependent dehydrogenase, methanol/ethanol family n=1 Tax=Sphingobium sp. JS3065 TaxID=2970925 RepID=UPI0022640518|nr:PQQ-dependent dehydrogenase, methanol/ethanol family [Sphingobium sp. JS3065]UZW56432.1 PQQ-dependent dehydrogenase, methanol/ethanol family [Sphingobium sp. JS3065]